MDADGNKIELKEGRYGAYVTNGKINVTLPKNMAFNSVTLEQSLVWIKEKAAKGPARRRFKKNR